MTAANVAQSQSETAYIGTPPVRGAQLAVEVVTADTANVARAAQAFSEAAWGNAQNPTFCGQAFCEVIFGRGLPVLHWDGRRIDGTVVAQRTPG